MTKENVLDAVGGILYHLIDLYGVDPERVLDMLIYNGFSDEEILETKLFSAEKVKEVRAMLNS